MFLVLTAITFSLPSCSPADARQAIYDEEMPRSQLLNLDFYLPMLFNLVRVGFILLFAYIAARLWAGP